MAGDIIKNIGEDLLMQVSKFARLSNKAAYVNSVARLAREYNMLLIERGIGVRRSSLKKLDRIDVRGIYQMPQNKYGSPVKMNELPTELETDYVNFEEGAGSLLHCILPCFAEGVMQLNANLELHWKVFDADMETQAEDVKLELYHDEGFGWAPVIIAQVRIKAPAQAAELPYVLYAFDTDVVRIPCEGELPGWEAVFHAIPVQDLPWNGKDKELWQVFIHGASLHRKDGEASLVEGDGDKDWKVSEFGQVAGLAKLWVSAVLAVNILLWARTHARKSVESCGWEKAEAMSGGEEKAETEVETGAYAGRPEVGMRKRTVRTIGGVTLVSDKPPKCVTAAGVRNYKVVEWKRRGHPRHYKSGKVIWIDETIAHRKAAGVPGTDALPVTIKVKGPRR